MAAVSKMELFVAVALPWGPLIFVVGGSILRGRWHAVCNRCIWGWLWFSCGVGGCRGGGGGGCYFRGFFASVGGDLVLPGVR